MILNREPALFYGLVAAAVQLVSALVLPLTPDQQGAVNAVVVLVGGCVLAWKVAAEKGVALLGGVAKALMALGLAFGAHLSGEAQSSIMLFVTMAVAFYVRGQVEAPVPSDMSPAAKAS